MANANAKTIEIKDDAFQYSKKFKAGSESNAGKYYVTDDGYMYETSSKTWPHFWYGFPFPDLDEKDPKAGYKVMYNPAEPSLRTKVAQPKCRRGWLAAPDISALGEAICEFENYASCSPLP